MPVDRDRWNACRFDPGSPGGHYESYFQRANHPERPLGFWSRYTIFCPKGHPEQALGELWAIWFDGERGTIAAAKQEVPWSACACARDRLEARIGAATLDESGLKGQVESGGHALAWDLRYTSPEPPLLLLPPNLYRGGFPKAKALVGAPNAVFSGTFTVDGEVHAIDGWVGSQCHNWGSRHTDRYAWGQVAGFDGAPDTFLECATARLKLGPLWTPPMTLIVLRIGGEQIALNSLAQAVRARGRVDARGPEFTWELTSRWGEVEVEARISARREAFVGLAYRNPPGGVKTCLNSKIAGCELTLRRAGRAPLVLRSRARAAFEILTDEAGHGVPIVA
ncbi:MAG TPA: hypothetical protein VIK91_26260 [Nannocystis sp.]